MSKIRCGTCRGQKRLVGIGGIEKDCVTCDGTGQVNAPKLVVSVAPVAPVTVIEAEVIATPVTVTPVTKGKRKSRAKPKAMDIAGVSVTQASKSDAIFVELAPLEPEPIFPPYEDEFMRAILEELTMDPFAWADKYKHVTSLFGISKITNQPCELITKVQRANIRTDYAYSKPISPRTDAMKASQEAVAEKDGAYQNYVAQEKARADRALKAAMPKMNGVLEKGRATGIGGV